MSSAQVQEIACAHGGYAWGGASLTRKQVGDHRWVADYEQGQGSFEGEWIIQVADSSAKTTEIAALETMLHPGGIFCVAHGRRVTVTDAVVSGTTLTTATGGFTTAADCYYPISVIGKGTAQITAVSADGKTLTLSAAVGNGTALTAFVGYGQIVTSAAGDKYDAQARPSCPGDPENTGLRWKMHIRVTWQISADQTRGVSGLYRRRGEVLTTRDESGHAVVTVSGIYTAGGGNDAQTNYAAQAATWIAAVLSAEGVVSSEVDHRKTRLGPYDDEKDLYPFSLTYRELSRSLPTSAARLVQMVLSRSAEWRCGLAGERAASWVRVSWASAVASTSTYDAHVTLYTGTIKPYLVAEAKARLGGTDAVIWHEEGPVATQGPEGNRIAGSLLILLTGINGNVLFWDENYHYSEHDGLVLAKRHDGQASTYVGWSNGGEYRAYMSVRARLVGERSPTTWDPSRASPPFSVAGLSGVWKRLGRHLGESAMEVGREPDAAGVVRTIWDYQWGAQFVFWADGSVEAPSVETGTTRLTASEAVKESAG
jgi:hypothetical protein